MDASHGRLSKEEILNQIDRLKLESETAVDDVLRQNEYDISRGIAPGKFREIAMERVVESNKNTISRLKRELQLRELAEQWSQLDSTPFMNTKSTWQKDSMLVFFTPTMRRMVEYLMLPLGSKASN